MGIGDLGQSTLQLIVLGVMLFGLFTVVFLPGLVIIWAAGLVYGLVEGFSLASGIVFAVFTLLAIFGSVIDNIVMGATARQKGASWWSIGAALVAGILGSFIVPVIGGLIAALLTLFAIEYQRLKDYNLALDSTKSMALGCGWAGIIRFGTGVIMILLWVSWVMWL